MFFKISNTIAKTPAMITPPSTEHATIRPVILFSESLFDEGVINERLSLAFSILSRMSGI